jgi:hypothetical protein
MMQSYRGIVHNHSACSKEGCYPLSTLRQRWASQLDFAAMTEHAERTTAQAYAEYVQECEALSDEQFRFIPGLEVATESGDMLLLGCRTYICTRNPLQVLREAKGCVILLAHPEEGKIQPEVLFQANGFEGWNSGHMGGYAPPLDWFPKWKQWLTPGKIVTGGNDIHKVDPKRKIVTTVQCASKSEKDILEAIRTGQFITGNGMYTLTPDGNISYRTHDVTKNALFAAFTKFYRLSWRLSNSFLEFGGTLLARLGVDKQKRTRLNRLIRQYF